MSIYYTTRGTELTARSLVDWQNFAPWITSCCEILSSPKLPMNVWAFQKLKFAQRILNWKRQHFNVITATKFAVSGPNFRTRSPEWREIKWSVTGQHTVMFVILYKVVRKLVQTKSKKRFKRAYETLTTQANCRWEKTINYFKVNFSKTNNQLRIVDSLGENVIEAVPFEMPLPSLSKTRQGSKTFCLNISFHQLTYK